MPRIPVIPNCNDSEENLVATADFIKRIGLDAVNILPFHRLGESKYRQLGRKYDLEDQPSPTDETMLHYKDLMQSRGIYCLVGWETPF
jgi:pyruvate-formate lyase-activating enzyme